MAYFSKFPILQYPSGLNSSELRLVFVRNLLRRISLTESMKSETSAFVSYDIKDGERPEHIAERVYGSTEYHWILLLCNEILDPYHDWYKSQLALDEYITKKYRGYRVYFTNSSDALLYDTNLFEGATLTQGNVSSSVNEYYPTYCSVSVSSSSFAEGSATITTPDAQHSVTIHRVEYAPYGVHHFQKTKGAADVAASTTLTLDPLSVQSASYADLGGSIGLTANPYPMTTEGINYTPSGTVSLWETYIGKYMGISGDKVNIYATSNTVYEQNKNEEKRTIRVLYPRFKKQAAKELENLLRV